jgi:hypothetical protein
MARNCLYDCGWLVSRRRSAPAEWVERPAHKFTRDIFFNDLAALLRNAIRKPGHDLGPERGQRSARRRRTTRVPHRVESS